MLQLKNKEIVNDVCSPTQVTSSCSNYNRVQMPQLDRFYSLNFGNIMRGKRFNYLRIKLLSFKWINIKANIMARHNVIYIEAWCSRDNPVEVGCARYG